MKIKIVNSFFNALITGLAMTGSAVAWADEPNSYISDSILKHEKWIHDCATNSTLIQNNDLLLYIVDTKSNDDTIEDCLWGAKNEKINSSIHPKITIYDSKFDKVSLGDGELPQMTEASIRTPTKTIIISAISSAAGITDVQHAYKSTYIVSSHYSTHTRNYLLDIDNNEIDALTDGDNVTIKTTKPIIFSATGRKSYFNDVGGAFWYDALIDIDGKILDITGEPTKDTTCMPRKELATISSLDLSRVKRDKVCIVR